MIRRLQHGFANGQKFTTLSQLVEHLQDYKPRCIEPGEDRDTAMHYSGEVSLAQKIIRMCSPEE